ncbi:hypothetical protein OG244_36955 [Streptomyces brevispora]|nr:hypothetical protein [Streptomyces brevispora]
MTLAVAAPTALAGLALGRYWRKAALATVVVAAASAALLVVRGAAPV